MKILKASNNLGLYSICNLVVFIIAYLAVMVLTYILPYFGSNSYAVGLFSSLILKGWGLMPQTWIHIWALCVLILIAYVRGAAIGKTYLIAFPIIATAFDLMPGLNSIPLVPTLMHLLTLVLGAISDTKGNSEESGVVNTAVHRAATGCLFITVIVVIGTIVYWSSLAYRKSQINQQKTQNSAPILQVNKSLTNGNLFNQAPKPIAPIDPATSPVTSNATPTATPSTQTSTQTQNVKPAPVSPQIPAITTTPKEIQATLISPVNRNTVVAQELLDDADLCFAKKKYECAINESNAALKLDPGNVRAKNLLQKAHAEQKKALDSISIQ